MSKYVPLGERILSKFGYRSEERFRSDMQAAIKLELENKHQWLLDTADAQYYDVFPDAINPVYANQSDMYRLSPELGTALDILGGDVGLSGFNVSRLVGEETREIKNHPLEVLRRHPNDLDSGVEFMRDTTMSYKLNGNAIWWLNRTSELDPPDELWVIPWEMIKPVPDGRMYLSHYNYFPGMGQEPIPLPTWQIVHFKTYNPKNRFEGLSPIESLVLTLQGNLGKRKTQTRQYTTFGGSPASILAFKDHVNNEAWSDVKTEARNAAMKNEMMMLRGVGDSVTWMSRAVSSKDSQFIESLEKDMQDIFNRMCPGLLAMLSENATEANALAARATYSEKTLWATLEVFAQKITSDILPAYKTRYPLIGQFDDPRVVDRKLELEEQSTYTKTHTIDQINEKYYDEAPLGDERGEMFVFETKSGSLSFGGAAAEDEQPAENMTNQAQETAGADVSMKAALDDLAKWRTMAIRGKALKAANFTSNYIPERLALAIKSELPSAKNKDEIAAVFIRAADSLQPKMQVDPAYILQGIEMGVKALEMSQK